ncbi:MAG: hypothetical protein V3V14_09690 [Saprospiraceae bacterium]
MKIHLKNLKFSLLLVLAFANSTFATETGDLILNARVYLEGAVYNSFETGETHGRPLMRDDLRKSPFNNQRLIPNKDIYQTPYQVSDYITLDITDKYTHVACGAYQQFQEIPNTYTVFAVQGENAIIDWVFVELRDKNDRTNVIATRSGLLQRDGDIVDLDGISGLEFPGIDEDYYYIAIHHRNHLAAMTKYAVTPQEIATLVDLSSYNVPMFDFGMIGSYDYSGMAMKSLMVGSTNVRALWGGDADANGKIVYHGTKNDLTVIHEEVAGFDMAQNPMFKTDFNNAIGYLQGDFDMNGKTKFDFPEDDKNLIFGQVLFYGLNSEYASNFARLIEQMP